MEKKCKIVLATQFYWFYVFFYWNTKVPQIYIKNAFFKVLRWPAKTVIAFTKRNKMRTTRMPHLYGESINFSNEVKYLVNVRLYATKDFSISTSTSLNSKYLANFTRSVVEILHPTTGFSTENKILLFLLSIRLYITLILK